MKKYKYKLVEPKFIKKYGRFTNNKKAFLEERSFLWQDINKELKSLTGNIKRYKKSRKLFWKLF